MDCLHRQTRPPNQILRQKRRVVFHATLACNGDGKLHIHHPVPRVPLPCRTVVNLNFKRHNGKRQCRRSAVISNARHDSCCRTRIDVIFIRNRVVDALLKRDETRFTENTLVNNRFLRHLVRAVIHKCVRGQRLRD